MDERVIEYFNTYFGGELNESTTHEDLIEAALDLVELRNGVLEVLKEANPVRVGRASQAFGARQRIHKAINNPATRKLLLHTKEGIRLVKRHGTSSNEEPSARHQRTKQLTKKAVESGPEEGQTPDKFHDITIAHYVKGHDDMSQRIERLKARGARVLHRMSQRTERLKARDAKRGLFLKSIGINSSYDPRLKENDEKNKILKFRKNDNDEGPHELGLRNVIRDTQVSADKNRAEVEKENQLAALLKVDTTKSPSQARKEIRKLAKETEQSRASQGKHRTRGAEARKEREAKGQGRLF